MSTPVKVKKWGSSMAVLIPRHFASLAKSPSAPSWTSNPSKSSNPNAAATPPLNSCKATSPNLATENGTSDAPSAKKSGKQTSQQGRSLHLITYRAGQNFIHLNLRPLHLVRC